MQGKSLRDQAQQFADAGCDVVGISFDTPAENRSFRDEHGFPFRLLSDTDRSVGAEYEVLRDPGEQFADYPKRIAYLIDPDGTISAAEEVTDPGGFGPHALSLLAAAQR